MHFYDESQPKKFSPNTKLLNLRGKDDPRYHSRPQSKPQSLLKANGEIALLTQCSHETTSFATNEISQENPSLAVLHELLFKTGGINV
jgi:hypothetical protein